MLLKDDLNSMVGDILSTELVVNQTNSVPEPKDIPLKDGAKKLSGTVLYADIASSSEMVDEFQKNTAAKIYKCFLSCCTKIIKENGGEIRSFDGDRVMGIFIGTSKNSDAAKAGLQIKYAVNQIIRPNLKNHFISAKKTGYDIEHAVGIDTSDILAIRSGLKGDNDIVWIGRAPNFAAKLCSIRENDSGIFVSADVYNCLNESSKQSKGVNMWTPSKCVWIGKTWDIYYSIYHWIP